MLQRLLSAGQVARICSTSSRQARKSVSCWNRPCSQIMRCLSTAETSVDSEQHQTEQEDEYENVESFDFDPADFSWLEDPDTSSIEDEPWKVVLAPSARASWRSTAVRRENALDAAVHAVLRKCKQPTNPKPTSITMTKIVDKLRKIARKRHNDREDLILTRYERKHKHDEAKNSGYVEVDPLLYGPHETVAHLRYRARSNFYVAKRVLEEARSLLGAKLQPTRILDFGIGCGGASAAALEVFGNDSKIEWIHGIDASATMREGAEHFLQEFVDHTNATKRANLDYINDPMIWSPRITMSAHLSSDPNMSAEQLNQTMTRGAFDLCLFSFTATEIPKSTAMLAATALLWEKLRPGGLLVMIEPGTPDGFSSIRLARNMLLDACPPAAQQYGEEQCHILAPCTHNGHCPLGMYIKETYEEKEEKKKKKKNQKRAFHRQDEKDEVEEEDEEEQDKESIFGQEDFVEEDDDEDNVEDDEDGEVVPLKRGYCSFIHTFPNKSAEKFSFFVAQKRLAGLSFSSYPSQADMDNNEFEDLEEMLTRQTNWPVESPEHEAQKKHVSQFAEEYIQSDPDHLGLNLVRSQRESFGRIVRAPKKRSGHTIIDACTDEGMMRHMVVKSDVKSAPGLFQAARKARWGGFWLKAAGKED